MRLKCRRIHFLHAADVPEAYGTQIGYYRLNYANGQQQEIPIIFGKDVLAWLLESPPDSAGPIVAWRKDHPNGIIQQLYKSTWENPRPDVEIGSLDIDSARTRSGHFVVAITAEP